jgi:hypothetical protein
MKKFIYFFIGALFVFSLYADESCSCDKIPNPLPSGKYQPTYNLSAIPQINCMKNVYVDASFIYWQPIEQGLDIGIDLGTASSQGKVYNVDMNFSPGFKIGLGGFLSKLDSWDLFAEYTWMTSKEKKTVSGGSLLRFNWVFANRIFYNQVDSIHSDIKLDFQNGEFLVGRIAYQGNHLHLKPVFGPKFSYIKHRFNLTADNLRETNSGSPATVDKYFVDAKSNSWLLGAKVGLESYWLVNCNFKFFAKLGQSLLYQRSDTKELFFRIGGNLGDGTDFNFKNKKSDIIFNTDILAGIGFASYFCHDKYFVDFDLGYDFNIYLNQNFIAELANDSVSIHKENGYLAFHGLRVNLRLNF